MIDFTLKLKGNEGDYQTFFEFTSDIYPKIGDEVILTYRSTHISSGKKSQHIWKSKVDKVDFGAYFTDVSHTKCQIFLV